MISCSHLSQLFALGSLLAFAAVSFGADSPQPPHPVPAVEAVDHLLLGVPDLEAGMKWFEEKTGVRPAPGGSHPGTGTQLETGGSNSRAACRQKTEYRRK